MAVDPADFRTSEQLLAVLGGFCLWWIEVMMFAVVLLSFAGDLCL